MNPFLSKSAECPCFAVLTVLLDKYGVQNLFFKGVVLLWNRIPLCAIQYAVNLFDKGLLKNVLSDPRRHCNAINTFNSKKICFSFKSVVLDCCGSEHVGCY